MGLFVDKGSGSGSGFLPDLDPDDINKPVPTGSGSATLLKKLIAFQSCEPKVSEMNQKCQKVTFYINKSKNSCLKTNLCFSKSGVHENSNMTYIKVQRQ